MIVLPRVRRPFMTPTCQGPASRRAADLGSLVVAEVHFVLPGGARSAVNGLDVAEAPPDLGRGVGLPVGADRGHLASWQGLRNAVGTGRRVLRVHVPCALALPQG